LLKSCGKFPCRIVADDLDAYADNLWAWVHSPDAVDMKLLSTLLRLSSLFAKKESLTARVINIDPPPASIGILSTHGFLTDQGVGDHPVQVLAPKETTRVLGAQVEGDLSFHKMGGKAQSNLAYKLHYHLAFSPSLEELRYVLMTFVFPSSNYFASFSNSSWESITKTSYTLHNYIRRRLNMLPTSAWRLALLPAKYGGAT
jgi:hypothetical protein